LAAGENWSIQIETTSSGAPINLYASNGIDEAPSRFHYDMSLSNMKESVTITQDLYNCSGSCVFAVQSIGYDQANNMATQSSINVTMVRSTPTEGLELFGTGHQK
jgi:hypothetical protein